MTSLVFPDLNVWVALTLQSHEHHTAAWKWYRDLERNRPLAFCRFTQLGLLRLVTQYSVAKEETLTQRGAWAAYDRWMNNGGCILLDDPIGLEIEFRAYTDKAIPAPKEWGDSYLAAFAASASLELITFDRALSVRAKRSVLLR